MDIKELRQRFLMEAEMLKIMLPFYVEDEDTTNTILDRILEIKRFIEDLDRELDNENNPTP